MKAIYLTRYGNSDKAFEVRETPIPKAGKGEVVIKIQYFGLNFADVVARRGLYPEAPPNPAVLGYDVAGTIHEVGDGVSHLKIGQKVVAITRFGGYAEYAVTQATGVAVLNDDMDMATAITLSVQGLTAYYCAYESVTLHKGDRVLIHAAAGGVGSILVQMAKNKGCIVYGTASTSKMDYLKSLGVDFPIDYTKVDFKKYIQEDLRTPSVDVVFDSLGGSTFGRSFKMLAPCGRIVSYGAAEQISGDKTSKLSGLRLAWGFGLFSPIQLIMSSKAIIGVNMLKLGDNRPNVLQHTLAETVKLFQQGIIKPRVDKIYPATEIAQAHDYLESRRSMGKVVMQWF